MKLVAGIGNVFLGDDAFGCEVARRLLSTPLAGDVRVVDFGIRGLDLVFALLDPYETVVLIDATPRGGVPGTLYTIEPDLAQVETIPPSLETHAMDPLRVLAVARSLGAHLERVILLGCEPERPEPVERMGLSEPVQRAVAEAAVLVAQLVNSERTIHATGG
jgi:hydrogenase maturation protease